MAQKIRKERITKAEWQERGGADNPTLFRLQSRGGAWRYYVRLDGENADNRKPGLRFARPTGRWMNGRKL